MLGTKNGSIKGPGMNTFPIKLDTKKGILDTLKMSSVFQHETLKNKRKAVRALRALLKKANDSDDDLLQALSVKFSALKSGSLIASISRYRQNQFVTLTNLCSSYGVRLHAMGCDPGKMIYVVVKWNLHRKFHSLDDVATWLETVVQGGLNE